MAVELRLHTHDPQALTHLQPHHPGRRRGNRGAGGGRRDSHSGLGRVARRRLRSQWIRPDGPVNAVAIQPDGCIVVEGEFTAYDGTSRPRIARFASTGALDASFDPGSVFDAPVHGLAVQADGDILAVGAFTSANGFRMIRSSGKVETTKQSNLAEV